MLFYTLTERDREGQRGARGEGVGEREGDGERSMCCEIIYA